MATSGNEGARLIEESPFDVVITDLVMNDIDGLGILARAKADQPDAEVILMTGHGTVPSAVEAMRSGAFNYLLKPLDIAQLRASAEKAVESSRLKRTNLELKRRLDERFGFEGVDRRQPADARRDRAAQAHRPDQRQRADPGRDRHRQGTGRPGDPPEQPAEEQAVRRAELRRLEREHFGERAVRPREGGVHRRLGRSRGQVRVRPRRHDVPRRGGRHAPGHADQAAARAGKRRDHPRRLEPLRSRSTCGSSRPPIANLEESIAAGTFRSDLYHRLKVVTIRLPTLRERSQDIPILIDYFIKQFSGQHGKQIRGMSPAARRKLLAFRLAGQRPPASQRGREHGGGRLRRPAGRRRPARGAGRPAGSRSASRPTASLTALVGKPLTEIERLFVTETLRLTAGNREEAAKMLGIGERTLYRKIKEFGL